MGKHSLSLSHTHTHSASHVNQAFHVLLTSGALFLCDMILVSMVVSLTHKHFHLSHHLTQLKEYIISATERWMVLCGLGVYHWPHCQSPDLASFWGLVQVEWSWQLFSSRRLWMRGVGRQSRSERVELTHQQLTQIPAQTTSLNWEIEDMDGNLDVSQVWICVHAKRNIVESKYSAF